MSNYSYERLEIDNVPCEKKYNGLMLLVSKRRDSLSHGCLFFGDRTCLKYDE